MTVPPTEPTPADPGPDRLPAELLAGVTALARSRSSPAAERGATSDLTIDQSLLLHAIGWEPVELVCGVSVVSVPYGIWSWGSGEISLASAAHNAAVRNAASRLGQEAATAGGHGVVGVSVEVTIHSRHIAVELTGSAVRPSRAKGAAKAVFVSDLSARDFVLLEQAGWEPVGLAFGASFVYAPRRTMGTAMRQKGQNVELTNFTEAMYSAREAAMARMQTSAIVMGGKGIVDVTVREGPMSFASHAVGFTAWGTAVRLAGKGHRYIRPQLVLPLDDARILFSAESLRGD